MLTLRPAEAKKSFLSLSRSVLAERKRITILSSSGKPAVVLDYKNRRDALVVTEMSAQGFKDSFSTSCRLASYGLTFGLRLKGHSEPVFARRHDAYRVPAQGILAKWSEAVAAQAIESEFSDIRSVVEKMGGVSVRIDDVQAMVEQLQHTVRLGMERIAIGHHPSREGRLGIVGVDQD